MNQLFLIICLLFTMSITNALTYRGFLLKYQKQYDPKRVEIYYQNLLLIRKHNSQNHSYQLGVNQFADLTADEFRQQYLTEITNKGLLDGTVEYIGKAPKSVDWRKKGAVTAVKDQGKSQCSWAFSSTGAMESLIYLKTGELYNLSEREMIYYQPHKGGFAYLGFMYAMNNGLQKEGCHTNCNINGITGWHYVPNNDQTSLELALTSQPVSVAIYASVSTIQFYSSGIYDDPDCLTYKDQLDHMVLAVGYGTNEDGNYWIIKNSWGITWGDQGYIYLRRGHGANICGVMSQPSVPM